MEKSLDLQHELLEALVTERGVVAMLVGAQILAFLLALSPMSYEAVWIRLGVFSLCIHGVTATSFTILYFIAKIKKSYSPHTEIIIIIVTFQIVTFFYGIFSQWFTHTFLLQVLEDTFLITNAIICLLVVLLFLYFTSIFVEKINTVKTLSKIELDALHARIRPHFLNNSLNTIAELTNIDPKAAEQATISLAKLSQAALNSDKLVNLCDEINLSKQYLELEKWRFSERFETHWHIKSANLNVTIPSLTLQPLIENAVNYGIAACSFVTKIEITIIEHNKNYVITISNDFDDQHKVKRGHGIAQSNIRARLNLHFGKLATLDTQLLANKYIATLTLPK